MARLPARSGSTSSQTTSTSSQTQRERTRERQLERATQDTDEQTSEGDPFEDARHGRDALGDAAPERSPTSTAEVDGTRTVHEGREPDTTRSTDLQVSQVQDIVQEEHGLNPEHVTVYFDESGEFKRVGLTPEGRREFASRPQRYNRGPVNRPTVRAVGKQIQETKTERIEADLKAQDEIGRRPHEFESRDPEKPFSRVPVISGAADAASEFAQDHRQSVEDITTPTKFVASQEDTSQIPGGDALFTFTTTRTENLLNAPAFAGEAAASVGRAVEANRFLGETAAAAGRGESQEVERRQDVVSDWANRNKAQFERAFEQKPVEITTRAAGEVGLGFIGGAAAVSAGRAAPRAARSVRNVDAGGVARRMKNVDVEVPTSVPEVRLVRDADAGLVDVDPFATRSLRRDVSAGVDRVRQTPQRADVAVRRTGQRARDVASATRFEASRARDVLTDFSTPRRPSMDLSFNRPQPVQRARAVASQSFDEFVGRMNQLDMAARTRFRGARQTIEGVPARVELARLRAERQFRDLGAAVRFEASRARDALTDFSTPRRPSMDVSFNRPQPIHRAREFASQSFDEFVGRMNQLDMAARTRARSARQTVEGVPARVELAGLRAQQRARDLDAGLRFEASRARDVLTDFSTPRRPSLDVERPQVPDLGGVRDLTVKIEPRRPPRVLDTDDLADTSPSSSSTGFDVIDVDAQPMRLDPDVGSQTGDATAILEPPEPKPLARDPIDATGPTRRRTASGLGAVTATPTMRELDDVGATDVTVDARELDASVTAPSLSPTIGRTLTTGPGSEADRDADRLVTTTTTTGTGLGTGVGRDIGEGVATGLDTAVRARPRTKARARTRFPGGGRPRPRAALLPEFDQDPFEPRKKKRKRDPWAVNLDREAAFIDDVERDVLPSLDGDARSMDVVDLEQDLEVRL